jgi:hypothetical protein
MKKMYTLIVAVIASATFAALSTSPAQAFRGSICGNCDGGGPPDCNIFTAGYTYTSGSGTYRCTRLASGSYEYVRV